MKMKWK